jgi:hypothetical protein
MGPMTTEQEQRQIDKWRKQQHVNRIVIGVVIGFLSLVALAGITVVLVNVFRPPHTFTPSSFIAASVAQGRTVRITGEVKWIDGSRLRLTDGKKSIYCEFSQTVSDLALGDTITVQGKVDSPAIIHCQIVPEP